MAAAPSNVADGLAPSHNFDNRHGYTEYNQPRSQENDDEPVDGEDASDDFDDIFDDGADEDDLDTEALAASNPADLTKSYNRQRKFNEAISDPNVPPWQYPKSNPQGKTPGSLSVDEQVASLNRHTAKLKLEDKY